MTSVTGPPQVLPAHVPTSLNRSLGLIGLTLFGIAYMVPLTVFSTLGPVAEITGNGVPGAYVVTLICMLFTALSYGKLTRRYPVAGSAYTYSRRAFGGHVGFLTGWALMLDYLLLPLINYLLIGLYLGTYFPVFPGWMWILLAIGLVTVLNILGIKSVSTFNGIVVTVQIVFAVVFIALSIRTVGNQGLPDVRTAFTGENGIFALFTGAAILCLSFLGFDAVTTLSEEAKNPQRDVPRAVLAVTFIGGLTFIVLSFVSYLVIPQWTDFENVDTASAEVMATAGGNWLSNFFIACLMAGAVGSALASQASVSRILYTMGRDGVLPRRLFGVLNKRFNSPARATLFVSAVSLLALVLTLEMVVSVISFGALAAFTMVNLAVIKTFAVDDGRRKGADLFRYIVFPFIAFALTAWLWTSLPSNAVVVGIVWILLSVVYLAVLTRGFRIAPPSLDMKE